MGSRLLRGLTALTLLTSFVAACGDDDDGAEATTTTEAAVEAQSVSFSAIDYAFQDAPTELEAGVIDLDFTNEGKVDHEVGIVEIGDEPLDEFLAGFSDFFVQEGAPLPEVSEHIAVPTEIGPGESSSTTFTLAEGTYALLCSFEGDADDPPAEEGEDEEAAEEGDEAEGEAPEDDEGPVDPAKIHFNRGMAQVLEVGPGSDALALPEADGAITARDWTFDTDLAGGDTTINFTNEGPNEVHFVGISLMPEGTDVTAAEAAFAAQFAEEGPPEGTVEPENDEFGFGGVYSSGLGGQITLEEGFESGRTYVLYCFISDRTGGPPHAFPEEQGGHGMYKAITVG